MKKSTPPKLKYHFPLEGYFSSTKGKKSIFCSFLSSFLPAFLCSFLPTVLPSFHCVFFLLPLFLLFHYILYTVLTLVGEGREGDRNRQRKRERVLHFHVAYILVARIVSKYRKLKRQLSMKYVKQ